MNSKTIQPTTAQNSRSAWQRARRPTEIAARRKAILDAARGLLDEEGIEAATLSEIARSAGLSKASCYRYFETREAILLEIAIEEVRGWADELVDRLAPLTGNRDIDGTARAFAAVTNNRGRFCVLLSSLSMVLERNVGETAILQFKRHFNSIAFETATATKAVLPDLSSAQLELFMRFLAAAIAGTWPAANPAPIVAGVMEREEFRAVRSSFEDALFDYCRLMLIGLHKEASRET